ncbi:DUF2628 domain-containing protein [Stenotrophomonas maltophilia]|uniref:DUF2628 domain-containing protein n=1 Tax=Stenotrophomonas maltophilia TaxID=40324 RepID=A0AA41CGS0_STEMA|nr:MULTISPECIES: DUF2628 domain-containing protein [Stenotrophomonas]AWB80563.1 DUF2628 domain-containing protein [Stenotrophomonas maltophilia]KOO85154.1 hypothetical protein VL21_01970 [Stenotrophomonas maltophilia]MBH1586043.1 DUF2628 domain-containing protein [Stenotrophomonas maltophilia]MBH1716834.1 DUF2628 domain-containing protein [Stenotrophomonas maltophilia]MBH1791857.1 DUF2628 domain-containing protein [Stenotrophomonas maltophilia]
MNHLDTPPVSPANDNPYLAPATEVDDAPPPSDADYLNLLVGPNAALYRQRWHLGSPVPKPPRPWHWPAFLVPTYWLLHRKMYLAAILFELVLIGIALLAARANPLLTVALLAVPRFAIAVTANTLYLRYCTRLLGKVKAAHAGQHNRIRAELQRRGGTSVWAVVIGMAANAVINTVARMAA